MTTSSLSEEQYFEDHRKAANEILKSLNKVYKTGPVSVAIEMIASRIVTSGDSLAVLQNNSPHDYAFDAASILRNIYDVMLQGLYIMVDPAKREERAKLYLDFMHVERKRQIELMDASDADLAKHFTNSLKRVDAKPIIEKQYNEVRAKYTSKKGKVRKKWYPGHLSDLAQAVGFEPEYELMQMFLSSVVHSSSLTLEEGPIVCDFLLNECHWKFAFRILGAYAEYKGIALNDKQYFIDSARRNIFDLPK